MDIFQLGGVVLIISISLLFYFQSRLVEIFSKSLSIIFIILTIIAVLGLFSVGIFSRLSDVTLQSVGIYKALVTIDEKIPVSKLTDTATDVFDDFWNYFEPQGDGLISDYKSDDDRGLMEANLYPVLVNLIGTIYRAFVTVASLIGMIFVTYLQYNLSEVAKLKKLEERIKSLEALNKK